MNSTTDRNSLKKSLLEIGFSENVIEIALWQTDDLDTAISYINDVIYPKNRSQIPHNDYKFLQLHYDFGYTPEEANKAAEKSSLSEAMDYLLNPENETKKPSQNQTALLPENLNRPIIQNRNRPLPQNRPQNQVNPRRRNGPIIRNFARNVGHVFGRISQNLREYRDDLFRQGGPVEIHVQNLQREGKNFETAFNILMGQVFRNINQRSIRNERQEENEEELLQQDWILNRINENENFLNREQLARRREEENVNVHNEEAYNGIITGEEIVINGHVIHPTPQLEIMNVLERYYRPQGISETNLNKLREIKYQAGTSPESCAICFEAFNVNESLQKLPCKHWFHNNCIKKWLTMSSKCPLDQLEI